MPDEHIPHLPRYAVTGDAWDTLDHEIVRALRPPAVAARLNPLEDAAVLEYQRSRVASLVDDEIRRHQDDTPEMTAELRASLDKHGSVADAYARRNEDQTP